MCLTFSVILHYDFYFITSDSEEQKELTSLVKLFDIAHYPLFFGIAILNFEGHPVALNVQASMKYPKRFQFVFIVSAFTISLMVITVSSLSYLAYGSEVEDLITLNLPHNDVTTLVRLLYSFGLLASFPLQLFPCLNIIENFKCHKRLPNCESYPVIKFLVSRTMIVIICGFISVSVPKFGVFLDFIGTLSGQYYASFSQ
ncbi:unnamed protein product [Moneuplotes crassus]|uniref:Amino acid transporter transmembrane domain-containing protein n=1 Tax=Euplotes crassus TaxID=5936 RepID=A0AAD2D0D0_EUPCR|nr:unnamed protein product [Moneuplotes crassus]